MVNFGSKFRVSAQVNSMEDKGRVTSKVDITSGNSKKIKPWRGKQPEPSQLEVHVIKITLSSFCDKVGRRTKSKSDCVLSATDRDEMTKRNSGKKKTTCSQPSGLQLKEKPIEINGGGKGSCGAPGRGRWRQSCPKMVRGSNHKVTHNSKKLSLEADTGGHSRLQRANSCTRFGF